MNVKIIGKTGTEYEVLDIGHGFKELIEIISLKKAKGEFLVFKNIAIDAGFIESVEII